MILQASVIRSHCRRKEAFFLPVKYCVSRRSVWFMDDHLLKLFNWFV